MRCQESTAEGLLENVFPCVKKRIGRGPCPSLSSLLWKTIVKEGTGHCCHSRHATSEEAWLADTLYHPCAAGPTLKQPTWRFIVKQNPKCPWYLRYFGWGLLLFAVQSYPKIQACTLSNVSQWAWQGLGVFWLSLSTYRRYCSSSSRQSNS